MLEGKNVRLREIRRADLPAILHWRNDPEVSQYLSTLTVEPNEIESWFERNQENQASRFLAIETESNDFIGYVGLRDIDWSERTAELDVLIGEKTWWNRGAGEEAINLLLTYGFSDLDLQKVSLGVLPFNNRAIRCYEKCGFRRAGFFKEYFYRQGKVWQPVHMDITREQFRLAKRISA